MCLVIQGDVGPEGHALYVCIENTSNGQDIRKEGLFCSECDGQLFGRTMPCDTSILHATTFEATVFESTLHIHPHLRSHDPNRRTRHIRLQNLQTSLVGNLFS